MKQVTTRAQPVTAEALLAMPDDGQRRELVAGEVVTMAPAGWEHGRIAHNLQLLVGNWVRAHSLGVVVTAETGFVLRRDPDTVRAPDLAFVAADRLPEPGFRGFAEVVPDLVAEVASPSDRVADVMAKVGDWLQAGVRLVWVLWPEERRISVFRSGSDIALLCEGDTLTCDELLPGFATGVSDVFG